MRVTRRVPKAVPARQRRERVLGAALCLCEQIFVVLVGGRELLRRFFCFERRPKSAAELAALRERRRRHHCQRECTDADARQAFD